MEAVVCDPFGSLKGRAVEALDGTHTVARGGGGPPFRANNYTITIQSRRPRVYIIFGPHAARLYTYTHKHTRTHAHEYIIDLFANDPENGGVCRHNVRLV